MRTQLPIRSSDAIWAGVTLVILGGWAFWAVRWRETAWDFTMFFVAAHAPIGSIHDQHVFQATARRVLAGTGVTYASPYVRPSVFALALHWMRALPYWEAYRVWALLQFASYAATLWVLSRRFLVRVSGFYPWVLFFPAFFGIITGQDSLGLGLVLCLALILLEKNRDQAGGALLSVTLYKFNLFLLVPVYLLLKKRHRALAVYGICSAALAGVSALLEPPSVYLALLPDIQRYTIGFSPRTMLGLRGLCASFEWTPAYPVAALALSGYALAVSRRMEFARGFGMILTACLLCAYHVTWYDGALLVLPFALALRDGGPVLRLTTVALMVIPFWNAMSAFVTALLLGFALLYSATAAWTLKMPDQSGELAAEEARG